MTHDTFQEEREAAAKWVRAQLTSAQLPTYFVGVQEHWHACGQLETGPVNFRSNRLTESPDAAGGDRSLS